MEIDKLLKQAVETNSAYAEQFGVSLVLKDALPGVKVNVDVDRLMQVLTNLISNAAKFSDSGEEVIIASMRQKDNIQVAVIDRGPGIPDEFRDRIFQKFTQARNTNIRRKSGSGLGLSISKAIIEKMAGKIGFETQIGVGTTFFFDLPEHTER
jgi:signal transduction histidine kinase